MRVRPGDALVAARDRRNEVWHRTRCAERDEQCEQCEHDREYQADALRRVMTCEYTYRRDPAVEPIGSGKCDTACDG